MPRTSSLLLASLATALIAWSSPASAQDQSPPPPPREHGGAGPRGPGGPMMMNFAERLVAHGTELKLTDDQVKRLDAIGASLKEKNRPYLDQLRAARDAQPDSAHRADMRRNPPPELRSAMEKIRSNSEAARKDAQAVLTADQRKQVEEKIQERRRQGGWGYGSRH